MAAPYSTVGGYGGNASLTVDPATGLSAGLADVLDGFPVLVPSLTAGGLTLAPSIINPYPINPAGGMPEINAIVIELRVLCALIREQMGDTRNIFDLQMMRADENWNTNPTTGAL